MTRLSSPNPIQLILTGFVTLVMFACGGGSGPSLPMRPDAGGTDAGVATLAIISPANNSAVTIDDDADGDATNGIQMPVLVAVSELVNGTVSLTVDDEAVELAEPIDGVATFQVTLSAERNARVVLTATAELTDGTTAESIANIGVQIEPCMLTVTPRPATVGCAFGPAADTNSDEPGVQTVFDIQANCPDLTVVANGASPISLELMDGTAQYETTVVDGNNELVFSLTDGFSDPVVDTLRFSANSQGGSIEIDGVSESRQNRYLVADGELDAGRVFWTLSGQTVGFDAGRTLNLTFEPELADTALTTTVRADGSFRVEVAVDNGSFYEGSLTLGGEDNCGSEASSVNVSVRFDATTPILSINSPQENSLLTAILDADDLRSGIQVAVEIGAIDTRPETVDYSIGVECAAVGPNPVYSERTIVDSDAVLRSALNDEDPTNNVAIATFQASEAGEFLCRPIIKEASNPPVNQSVLWRTYFREATLNVLLPSAFPSCVSQTPFEIRTVGQNIDGNRPILFYRLTPEGGAPGQQPDSQWCRQQYLYS